MIRILHYIQVFSQESEGFIYDLIRFSEELGIRNRVLTQRRMLKKERPMRNVFVTGRSFFVKVIRRITHQTEYEWYARSCSIIHCHFGPNGAHMYKNLNGEKILTSFHGTDILSLYDQELEYREVVNLMIKDKRCFFTANSEFLYDQLIKRGFPEQRTFKLYNTYNSRYDAADIKPLPKSQKIKLLTVGRLVEVKGHELLILAVYELRKNGFDLELSIVGEGPLREKLLTIVNGKNLGDHVNFLGYIEPTLLPEIYTNHHIYVQPSVKHKNGQQEAFGIAALEAAICNLYIVVSNSGGLTELLDCEGAFGEVFESGSTEALVSGIKSAIREIDRQDHNHNFRNHLIEKYGNNSYKKKLESIYHLINNETV